METFVSSMLRTVCWKGDDGLGLHRIDPFPPGSDTETRFLEASKSLFWEGWQLGSASSGSPQWATSTNNRLAQGLLAYFTEVSQTPLLGVKFFQDLAQQDPLVNELVVGCLFAADQEHTAVALSHRTVTQDPRISASILRLQAEWLLTKGVDELQTAERLVRFSIQLAPLDLDGWIQLADIHLRLGQYEKALSTLNSFPPYILNQPSGENTSSSSQPTHTAYWQPRNDFTMVDLSAIEPANKRDSPLEHLRSPHLSGAAAAAFDLLARMLEALGWDGLLEKRAAVFVMEEDWNQIRRSTSHQARDADDKALMVEAEELSLASDEGISPSNRPVSPQRARVSSPQPAQQIVKPASIGKKKKLCERWLDSLFLVLFDDLRLLSLYQAERSVAQSEGRVYQRTPREWLLLGKLCSRLCHLTEAKDAYERCLDTGFSRGAWTSLLHDWAGSKDKLSHALTACIHLVADSVNRRVRPAHPSVVSVALRKLVALHGLGKVREALQLLKPAESTVQFIAELISAERLRGCTGTDF
jgi:tetratricopeptide (TPR) repeat protein